MEKASRKLYQRAAEYDGAGRHVQAEAFRIAAIRKQHEEAKACAKVILPSKQLSLEQR